MTRTKTPTTERPVPSGAGRKVHDDPLSGLVVVGLSTALPGALGWRLLADCAAEVTMVEPVDGSPLREVSGWPALLQGKPSVTTVFADGAGRSGLGELPEGADVVVSTLSPSATERLGLQRDCSANGSPGWWRPPSQGGSGQALGAVTRDGKAW